MSGLKGKADGQNEMNTEVRPKGILKNPVPAHLHKMNQVRYNHVGEAHGSCGNKADQVAKTAGYDVNNESTQIITYRGAKLCVRKGIHGGL